MINPYLYRKNTRKFKQIETYRGLKQLERENTEAFVMEVPDVARTRY